MPRTVITREDPVEVRAPVVIERLTAAYPDAKVALRFSTPLECLIATILSAQCTDEKVNEVTATLFVKYRTPADYLDVPEEELKADIHPTGFFNQKAASIRAACTRIVEVYDGEVPGTMEDLITLRGVARKTANIVLGNSFGIVEGIAVDTHVRRVANRLGFSQERDADKIEAGPDAPRAARAVVRVLLRHDRPRPGDLHGAGTPVRRVPGRGAVPVEPGVRRSDGDELAGGDHGAASTGPPDLAALLLVETAPHAGVLARDERPLEAVGPDRAPGADRLRHVGLVRGERGGAHREEQLGVLADAVRLGEPPHLVGVVLEAPFSHRSSPGPIDPSLGR